METVDANELERHLTAMGDLVRGSCEPLEGNCFYAHYTMNRRVELEPKQRNLCVAACHGNKVLEIGFNAGHSALLFLLANPRCTVQIFDMGEHAYSRPCFDYLSNEFPGRMSIVWGDSCVTVPNYICDTIGTESWYEFDVVHIDGGHTEVVCESDIRYARLISSWRAWVIIDDIRFATIQTVVQKLAPTMLEPVPYAFEQTLMYGHKLYRYRQATVVICSLVIGAQFRDAVRYSTLAKIHYCAQQFYDLCMDVRVYDNTRPAAWSKIRLLQTCMRSARPAGCISPTDTEYDTVVWMDADLYIMNGERRLEEWIDGVMGDHDMLMGKDWKILNSGVWFLRNCAYNATFLQHVYDNYLDLGNYEQDAFIKLYDDNVDNIQSHCAVVYHMDFNSYLFNYLHGHFVLHLCGCRELSTLEYAMRRFCPLRRDGENDTEYDTRMNMLRGLNLVPTSMA